MKWKKKSNINELEADAWIFLVSHYGLIGTVAKKSREEEKIGKSPERKKFVKFFSSIFTLNDNWSSFTPV